MSYLPITGGRVRVLLLGWHPATLAQEDWLCEPWSLASPFALPLCGDYDGYGGVENLSEGVAADLLFARLGGLFREGRIHIEDEDEFPADLAAFLSLAERTRVSAAVSRRGPFEVEVVTAPLCLMFVLDEVYRSVVDAVRDSSDGSIDQRLETNPWEVAEARFPSFGVVYAGEARARQLDDELRTFLQFDHGLELLRRCYMPATAVGAQARALPLHGAVAEAALRHIAEAKDDDEL